MATKQLTPISRAERALGLPVGGLALPAAAGQLPHVKIAGRLFVHLPTIERLLLERAGAGGATSPATVGDTSGESANGTAAKPTTPRGTP
jgi:hypothetical protein